MLKGNFGALFVAILLFSFSANSHSIAITTSGSANLFGDDYSYSFSLEDVGVSSIFFGTGTQFNGVFTNTSSMSLSGALIDAFAFNTTPTVSCCDASNGIAGGFYITNDFPNWDFSTASGGVQFDYLGDRTTPSTRLGPGDSLTFQIHSLANLTLDMFTSANESTGMGFGGGQDSGQVCTSFQQLGSGGQDSDLVCSNWGDTPPVGVPEPTTMALMGLGLVGLGITRRKKKSS